MADWSKPTITSNYVTFVDEVKGRDIDAITLQVNPLVNPPTGSIKLVRAPVKFQEWDGAAFVDKPISVEGGGTAATTAAGARTNFGLGTMATQNSNAIAVTGGTIRDIASSVAFSHHGTTFQVVTSVAAQFGSSTSAYGLQVSGYNSAGQSSGLLINAGTNSSDTAFNVSNVGFSRMGLAINGDMVCSVTWRLVIPVGTNYWAS